MHRHFVKDRYPILGQLVQDEALQIDNRQSVRDDRQMSRQVVQDEDLGHGHFVQDRYPLLGRFVQDPGNSSETQKIRPRTRKFVRDQGNSSETKRFRTTTSNHSGMIPKCPRKSSRTRTLGKGTLFKRGTQYPVSSYRRRRLELTAGQWSILNAEANRPGRGACAQAPC